MSEGTTAKPAAPPTAPRSLKRAWRPQRKSLMYSQYPIMVDTAARPTM